MWFFFILVFFERFWGVWVFVERERKREGEGERERGGCCGDFLFIFVLVHWFCCSFSNWKKADVKKT